MVRRDVHHNRAAPAAAVRWAVALWLGITAAGLTLILAARLRLAAEFRGPPARFVAPDADGDGRVSAAGAAAAGG